MIAAPASSQLDGSSNPDSACYPNIRDKKLAGPTPEFRFSRDISNSTIETQYLPDSDLKCTI